MSAIGTHWIALYTSVVMRNILIVFGVEYIPKEIHRKQKYHNKYL